jgi:hypothetical protein
LATGLLAALAGAFFTVAFFAIGLALFFGTGAGAGFFLGAGLAAAAGFFTALCDGFALLAGDLLT